MAVGHPDYWRRMVSRISIEGYSPEYYHGRDQRQIDAGEFDTVIFYSIPVGYLFNLTGFFVACNKPGLNSCTINKYGDVGRTVYFDSTITFHASQGLLATMQYGDILNVVIANNMDYNALFTTTLIGMLEFEG